MKKLYPSFADPEKWRDENKDDHATLNWREIRKKILIRDQYTCKYCGFGANKWQIVHHIDGNPDNNNDSNLETICPMCNLINHSGQGCVVQGIVDLYKESKFTQNIIIQITRKMRANGKKDKEIIEFLGLKNKVPFKMDKNYLKKLYGFITSRNTNQNWTQRALEYGYNIRSDEKEEPNQSLSKFI